uniref:ABC transporter permease n=1 Tax=Clostridioides difficile TaxID=1496 RepID=A0A381KMU7_CLODI|nr:ABC transporter permease [Clostridioides difficile]
MNVSLTPETNGKLEIPERQNVNISFVKVVPPDSPPGIRSSDVKKASFRVLAPYSAKDKFEIPGVSTGIESLSFQSKILLSQLQKWSKLLRVRGVTNEYNLYNM